VGKSARMSKYLVLTNSNEVVRVTPERIVYILSDGNYSTMTLVSKEEHVFSFNLASFERIIEQQLGTDAQTFIRLGKSLIINGRYIYYVNISKQQIVLSDGSFPDKFTLSASKEALKALKTVLEDSIKSRRIGI
jgi:DNA-binding LytR/AlgR family response regulator